MTRNPPSISSYSIILNRICPRIDILHREIKKLDRWAEYRVKPMMVLESTLLFLHFSDRDGKVEAEARFSFHSRWIWMNGTQLLDFWSVRCKSSASLAFHETEGLKKKVHVHVNLTPSDEVFDEKFNHKDGIMCSALIKAVKTRLSLTASYGCTAETNLIDDVNICIAETWKKALNLEQQSVVRP